LRVLRDVLAARLVRRELVVMGRYPAVIGEKVAVHLGAPARAFAMQVAASVPAIEEGTVRHRISLLPDTADTEGETLRGEAVSLSDPLPCLGVLASEIRVRLLNCSSSGCLLESPVRLPVGTVASLRLPLGSGEFSDDLKCVRLVQIEGASSYYVGAEFLWTVPPGRQSLRLGVGHRKAQHVPLQ
jgi:hypothetical protein